MKKTSALSLIATAVLFSTSAFSATDDTASATANWQGVVPGISIPDGSFIVTGKDKAITPPIGQLTRAPEGNLTATLIDLEARNYTPEVLADASAVPPVSAAAAEVGDLVDATWAVDAIKFYSGGVEVRGVGWEVFDNATSLATVDAATGNITNIDTAHSAQVIKLTVRSDEASNALIDKFAGKEGALSVTMLATQS